MREAAAERRAACSDPRARVLGVDELLDLLEQRAEQAAAEAEALGLPRVRRWAGTAGQRSQLASLLLKLCSLASCRLLKAQMFACGPPPPFPGLKCSLLAASLSAVPSRLQASRGERLVVGLTGYPNVGKSSTINALFGSKKTAVAPTPGKTKHFQVGGGCCWPSQQGNRDWTPLLA